MAGTSRDILCLPLSWLPYSGTWPHPEQFLFRPMMRKTRMMVMMGPRHDYRKVLFGSLTQKYIKSMDSFRKGFGFNVIYKYVYIDLWTVYRLAKRVHEPIIFSYFALNEVREKSANLDSVLNWVQKFDCGLTWYKCEGVACWLTYLIRLIFDKEWVCVAQGLRSPRRWFVAEVVAKR